MRGLMIRLCDEESSQVYAGVCGGEGWLSPGLSWDPQSTPVPFMRLGETH